MREKMSLDCDYDDLYQRPRRDVVSYLVSIGEARQMLKELVEHSIFDTLNKHNPLWHSENEYDAGKLEDARMTLKYFEDKLLEALEKME